MDKKEEEIRTLRALVRYALTSNDPNDMRSALQHVRTFLAKM